MERRMTVESMSVNEMNGNIQSIENCQVTSANYYECKRALVLPEAYYLVPIFVSIFPIEISEVWSRLFDHRPFLSGEIKFMLREFEEKRGDREVENLFAIVENLTEIKDTQVERISKNSIAALPVLAEKLEQALKLSDQIEKDYLELQKINKEKKAKNFEKRQKEWDQFIDDMNFKCQRIDNTFEEKEEELRDLYADLNHKLNITNK
ncbi:jg21518 [Pararge aegeria aegeria]|uniref:Biogenesis of lysosome-related organelles complex 1 subunit 5 n=2 Tax=Pararge aegeria TaxID=116150 RepID=A0A8S4RPE4_9NEOP|nr:jg21518 [Pararge aegeria aegeria]